MPPDQRPPTARVLTLLAEGEVEVLGRMPWSSNRTFLVTCSLQGEELAAIYKPGRGERQLWDFPEGVYRREVVAYRLSEVLGWGLVPETIVREDGPYGPGSFQRFVAADFEHHHFTLVEDPAHHERLRAICAFDVVANNADRKSGHCLLGEDGTIWAIDNGLCFHVEPKLRTVIWEFAGEPLPPAMCDGLGAVAGRFDEAARDLLSAAEVRATVRRARALLEAGRFPEPDPDRYHYPWPLV
ncbi:MAG TPA: SCO1664 family protein [Acidimicrobiales bacterium]|nr:SCO1664 family protein [Acidimicrobiales bacterium]